MYKGAISLVKNNATEFHVLPAGKIPRNPSEIFNAPWLSNPALIRKPNPEETKCVVLASNGIEEMAMPSSQEFRTKTEQAMNVKDKFSLLKDVKPDGFYNILGQVVRIFDGALGTVTVYLSDYSANSFFYPYAWDVGQESDTHGRDEYGNNKAKPMADKAWPGPYGKLTIQLTLFDAHAQFVREYVKADQWLLLKNVHMKFGKNGESLEGFLRGDPNQYEGTVRVEVMEQKQEKDENDARWTDAVRRKYEYEKKFKKQRQDLLNLAAGVGEKRKRDNEPEKMNAKKRRQERRAAAEGKVAEAEARIVEKLNLNANSTSAIFDHDRADFLYSSMQLPRHAYTEPFNNSPATQISSESRR
jgi:hypothetical protein